MSYSILNADLFDGLATLADNSVHCAVTSPPYWGLRDYGIPPRTWADGSVCPFGNEPTPDLYIDHAVQIFRAIKRVLRDDGTLWLNLGDSYYSGNSAQVGIDAGKHSYAVDSIPAMSANRLLSVREARQQGLKPGDLCNIPNSVATALRNDGWYWRSTIIWSKGNPMPESVSGTRWVRCRLKLAGVPVPHPNAEGENGVLRNLQGRHATWAPCPGCDKCRSAGGYVLQRGKWRPTTSHEYIYMFSKGPSYFCDGEAAREPVSGTAHSRGTGVNPKARNTKAGGTVKQNRSFSAAVSQLVETKNPRTVWNIGTYSYRNAHFATFPPELPRRCIVAGTAATCCSQCGAPYAPVVDTERVATRPGNNTKVGRVSQHTDSPYEVQSGSVVGNRDPQRHVSVRSVTGHLPTCRCGVDTVIPATVLDPFAGSGTTGQVAHSLGRHAILIEVNPDYVSLIEERVKAPLRPRRVTAKRNRHVDQSNQRQLF